MNTWPEIHAAWCVEHPAAPLWYALTPAKALERLERQLANLKAYHTEEEEMSDDEAYEAMLEKKTYLKGLSGAHDRATIWAGGVGTIGGEGGLITGHNPRLTRRGTQPVISDDDLPGQASFLE